MPYSKTFRTTFTIPPSDTRINYSKKVLWSGSCFTENLGLWLQNHGVKSMVNPFGILYNPTSIASSIKRIKENHNYTDAELEEHNNTYLSFDHHGRFSGHDKTSVLNEINNTVAAAHTMLKEAHWLFITFGSAWAFRRRSTGKVVANCHKLPGTEFDRVLLSLDEMAAQWRELIAELLIINPVLHIVFTVSPVRHLRDGAVENQRSKALLLTLIHDLCDEYSNCSYFPAYEIMMDDLRDYRYYAGDMIHPSEVAVKYIRDCFMKVFFDDNNAEIFHEMEQLVKASEHRIENSNSDVTRTFIQSQLKKINELIDLQSPPELTHLEKNFMRKLSELD